MVVVNKNKGTNNSVAVCAYSFRFCMSLTCRWRVKARVANGAHSKATTIRVSLIMAMAMSNFPSGIPTSSPATFHPQELQVAHYIHKTMLVLVFPTLALNVIIEIGQLVNHWGLLWLKPIHNPYIYIYIYTIFGSENIAPAAATPLHHHPIQATLHLQHPTASVNSPSPGSHRLFSCLKEAVVLLFIRFNIRDLFLSFYII